MHSKSRALASTLRTASALVLVLGACGPQPASEPGEPETPLAAEVAPLPDGHPPLDEPVDAGEFVSFEGEVTETMDGGGYTYARLIRSDGQGDVWVAGPVRPLSVGATVVVRGATSMGAFTSTSMDRTFDELYFAGALLDPLPTEGTREGLAREVLTGAGYTYVRVESEGTELWLAGPEAEVREGDRVAWIGGTAMGEFTSSTLGRTFDDILFVERIGVR